MNEQPVSGVFRDVNERIAEITRSWEWEKQQGFLCECTRDDCTDAILLTRAQYESIRAEPERFVTLPGHERAEVEQVVEDLGAFVVVERPSVPTLAAH